ncbi:MAG: hypothetical protein M3Q87_00505 [Actinomycetota bacterium]|nr:hypothetical protein [Actinomycetota bacterium]
MSTNAKGKAVAVAPGLGIARLVTVTVEDWSGYDVAVEVVPEGGRLVAQEVRVHRRDGGPAVTGEAIRSVPVAALTKQAARHVLTFVQKDGYTEWTPTQQLTAADVAAIQEAGPTTASLRWVAYLYRLGLVMGDPPTRTVEKALELPRSTAGRWVALARERGFLGPAEGAGKAGG